MSCWCQFDFLFAHAEITNCSCFSIAVHFFCFSLSGGRMEARLTDPLKTAFFIIIILSTGKTTSLKPQLLDLLVYSLLHRFGVQLHHTANTHNQKC